MAPLRQAAAWLLSTATASMVTTPTSDTATKTSCFDLTSRRLGIRSMEAEDGDKDGVEAMKDGDKENEEVKGYE